MLSGHSTGYRSAPADAAGLVGAHAVGPDRTQYCAAPAGCCESHRSIGPKASCEGKRRAYGAKNSRDSAAQRLPQPRPGDAGEDYNNDANENTRLAQIVWTYLNPPNSDRVPDVVVALGSHDLRVARFASQLALMHDSLLLVAGGLGPVSRRFFSDTEAETFAEIARGMGVPAEKLLLEKDSQNTFENARFSQQLYGPLFPPGTRGTIVGVPYLKRRALATFQMQWPAIDWAAAGPGIVLSDGETSVVDRPALISRLANEVFKLHVYAERGHIVKIEVPDSVYQAAAWLTEPPVRGKADLASTI